MENYLYSIIIPHHNCPDLLKRCVDSIPVREDLQIIIVDDNSEGDKKPIIERKGVEIILLDADLSKGAGRARNIGLEHARGKWLLFADADDFYETKVLESKLESYAQSKADIVFLNADKIDADTLRPVNSIFPYNNWVKKNNKDSLEWLRYRSNVPWSKFVKRELVESHNILFSECIAGNDILFSVKTGHYAQDVLIDSEVIYHWCFRATGNISSNKSREAFLSRFGQSVLRNDFLREVGKKEWTTNIIKQYYFILKDVGFSRAETISMFWKNTPRGVRLKHLLETSTYILTHEIARMIK